MDKIKTGTKFVIIFFTFLGVFAIAINTIFGADVISYLDRVRIETTDTWIYTFNIGSYITNININASDTAQLVLRLPERQWISTMTLENWTSVLVNNLALMVDYLIVFINILGYPFRIGGYLTQTFLAVMGVEIFSPKPEIQWLTDLLQTLKSMQIPYI